MIFTVSSLLCGIAPSLGMLILFRVIQGAGGGGLQPVSQAILRDTFPPEQLGAAFAVYGMVVVLAPAIGPTIGGWITDNYQWRWIFYMNVPVGIVSLLLVSRLIEDPEYLTRQLKKLRGHMSIDYIGIGFLALSLGALQVMLDKGQEDNWYYSPMIATLMVIFPVALVLFIAWELSRSKPVMDLRMFKNRNFAAAAAMIFAYGVQVCGMTVFTPQYVQAYMGYDAELAGKTQLPGALLLIVLMPVTAKLVRRIEARWLIAVGFLLSTLASFYVTTNCSAELWTSAELHWQEPNTGAARSAKRSGFFEANLGGIGNSANHEELWTILTSPLSLATRVAFRQNPMSDPRPLHYVAIPTEATLSA